MKSIYHILGLIGGLLLLSACSEDEGISSGNIEIEEFKVVNKTGKSYTLSAAVSESLANRIVECGFYYSDNPSMQGAERIVAKMMGASFSAEITMEGYEKTYYCCSFISNGRTEKCSDAHTIKIGKLNDYVEFGDISIASYDKQNGNVGLRISCDAKKGVNVEKYGILYGASSDLLSSGTDKELSYSGSGNEVNIVLYGLAAETKYYACQYLKEGHTVYGPVQEFYTYPVPKVEIGEINNVSYSSADVTGNVSSEDGLEIISRGFVWSKNLGPTLANSEKIDTGTGNGPISYSLSGLSIGAEYHIRAYASTERMTYYSPERSFRTDNVTDLSAAGTANCYIVSESGLYMFKAAQGNDDGLIDGIASCDVLWETLGTSEVPSSGDLIQSASYQDGHIVFRTNSSFKKGNALLSAKDSKGTILWSWHIWFTDHPREQVYNNNAGTMMDRNLGATSATPGDVGALGLLYQWGRKDPFLASSTISSAIRAKADSNPFTIGSSDYYNPVPTNPTRYYRDRYNGYNRDDNKTYYDDWLPTSDDNLWRTSKTVYDPCPAGWRVPDSNIWQKAAKSNKVFKYDPQSEGIDFGGLFGRDKSIWYPSSMRYDKDGDLTEVGFGGFWSCEATTVTCDLILIQDQFAIKPELYGWGMDEEWRPARLLYFKDSGEFAINGYSARACAYAIRCQKIQ